MPPRLADVHITLQERLRAIVGRLIAQLWGGLPNHDQEQLPVWLGRAVPLVMAAGRQSTALTDAFLGHAMDREPLGVEFRYPRPVDPFEVYTRPFITYYTAVKDRDKDEEQAIFEGLDRATSAAQTDVQLAMRQTLVQVGEQDDLILGYRRVPDADACEFCKLVSGQRYHTSELMPVHNHCGCGVDVITAENRGDFGGKQHLDRPHVAVREHGELGPVLVDPAHDFTAQADL